MRSYMRDINLGRDPDDEIPAAVGMEGEAMYEMFRLLALAKYDERYVIPTAHAEQAHALEELATDCAVDSDYGGRTGDLRRGLGRARPRSPSRTSGCSRSASPPTTDARRRQPEARPGQPAQLGRQGCRREGIFPKAPKDRR